MTGSFRPLSPISAPCRVVDGNRTRPPSPPSSCLQAARISPAPLLSPKAMPHPPEFPASPPPVKRFQPVHRPFTKQAAIAPTEKPRIHCNRSRHPPIPQHPLPAKNGYIRAESLPGCRHRPANHSQQPPSPANFPHTETGKDRHPQGSPPPARTAAKPSPPVQDHSHRPACLS